jgi:hypothetical protein
MLFLNKSVLSLQAVVVEQPPFLHGFQGKKVLQRIQNFAAL